MSCKDIYTVPNYEKCALIIIDFQNDCVLPGAQFEIAGSFELLPKLQQLVKAVRERNIPIIHVVRAYLPDGSNADLCRRESLQKGHTLFEPYTEGADFPMELKPVNAPAIDWNSLMEGNIQQLGSCDWVVYKSRWGAFYRTALEEFLRNQGIDTLIFTGCNFPNCPRTSIYEASERDFRLVLVRDAMSGLYERGLKEMEKIGVVISNVEEVCAVLSEQL